MSIFGRGMCFAGNSVRRTCSQEAEDPAGNETGIRSLWKMSELLSLGKKPAGIPCQLLSVAEVSKLWLTWPNQHTHSIS